MPCLKCCMYLFSLFPQSFSLPKRMPQARNRRRSQRSGPCGSGDRRPRGWRQTPNTQAHTQHQSPRPVDEIWDLSLETRKGVGCRVQVSSGTASVLPAAVDPALAARAGLPIIFCFFLTPLAGADVALAAFRPPLARGERPRSSSFTPGPCRDLRSLPWPSGGAVTAASALLSIIRWGVSASSWLSASRSQSSCLTSWPGWTKRGAWHIAYRVDERERDDHI